MLWASWIAPQVQLKAISMPTSKANRDVVQQVRQELEGLEAPQQFLDTIQSHCGNLERLASSLRQLGMDDQVIDRHVLEVYEEYKSGLKTLLADQRIDTETVSDRM